MPARKTKVKTPDAPGVYIAGTSNLNGSLHAVYWKDGALTELLPDPGVQYATAAGIVVSGNDIFVGGSVSGGNAQGELAAFWKNGEVHTLPSEINFARLSGIAVADGHVYTCGLENYGAAAWIDEKQTISKPFDANSRMTGIAVSGGDVIIAGTDSSAGAGYYKNGKIIKVDPSKETMGDGVTVSGNDIYLAGTRKIGGVYTATYWKNKVPVSLGEGYGNSIAIDGGDVYVLGKNLKRDIVYWKNGKISIIGPGYPSGMAVKNGDVYIPGTSADSKAGYWKNGEWTELFGLEGSQENTPAAIAVK